MSKKNFTKIICRIPNEPFENLQSIVGNDLQKKIVNDPKFLYALFIASPSLYDILIQKKGEILNENLIITLLKYYTRSSYRNIPFGIFSSSAIIPEYTSEASGIIEVEEFYTKTLLDFIFWKNNYYKDSSNNSFSKLNPSIRIVGEKIKYIESTLNSDGNNDFTFTSIDKGGIEQDNVLDYDFNKIKANLLTEGYDIEEIETYQKDLSENGILINDNTLSPIFDQKQQQIYENSVHSKPIYELLKVADTTEYTNILSQIERQKDTFDTENSILNVVSFFKSNSTLSKNQLKLAQKAMAVLDRIEAKSSNRIRFKFENFIDAFEKKYEDETIPLLEVFDPETGIDYSLINESNIDAPEDPIDEILFRQIDLTNKKGNGYVNLTDSLLNSIEDRRIVSKNRNPLNCVRLNLYKDTDNSDICNITSVSRRTPIEIFSRFTHIDEDYLKLSQEIADYEQKSYSNAILAEIDYLPHIKSGNIIQRGQFRKYTIKIDSVVKSTFDIPLNDLYLKYDSGNIILFSKRLNKVIVPCFSNAHDYRYYKFNPLVRFLIELGNFYGENGSLLSVNAFHKYYSRVPRIVYEEKIILSKESWVVRRADFFKTNEWKEKNISDSVLKNAPENIKKLELPNKFEIIDDDVITYIDTTNILMLKIFLKELKKKRVLYIKEILLDSFKGIVKSEKGTHNAEFFMFLGNPQFKDSISKNITKSTACLPSIVRKFAPGSEWLYYKIYLKPEYCNKLIKSLSPLISQLQSENKINSFFYIKFYDPDFHIRLRFNVDNSNLVELMSILKKVLNPYLSQRYIHNIDLSTYTREIERYGIENMEIVEKIFHIDSIISINILNYSTEKYGTNFWLPSIRIVKEFLTILIDTENEIISFVKNMIDILKKELNITKEANIYINNLYKELKDSLFAIYDDNQNNNLYNILKESIEVLNFEKKSKNYYAGNLIHMHITRIVNINNKYYEYVIYNIYLKILLEKKFKK